jgi:xanthine dehydrogenase YagT iron-sulfur-binding subunit
MSNDMFNEIHRHDDDPDNARSTDALGSSEAPVKLSRRTFLTWVSASGVAMTARGPDAHAAPANTGATASGTLEASVAKNHPIAGSLPLHFTLNGKPVHLQVDPRATLLDTLRENVQLTGTKKGCDHGQCGACTVHVNGRRINSCLSLAVMNEGAHVTTIEGLGQPGNLHPMQQAFVDHDGYQCGYCTSGQIMSAVGLLNEPWGQNDADVQEAMSGNICRCGAYKNIVAAIQQVRKA